MLADGSRPILVLHPVADEIEKLLAPAAFDQPFAKRMALCIQWHYVRRVFLHRKHLTERNAAARFQELNEISFLLRDFARVFDRRACAFIRPARQRLAEMRSEN